MKKIHYTEEQIDFALKQAETSTCVKKLCSKMDISEAIFTSMDYLSFSSTESDLRLLLTSI